MRQDSAISRSVGVFWPGPGRWVGRNPSTQSFCRSKVLHTFRARLVNAERLFIQIVACGGKSARAASHTDIAKLAAAALAFQIVDVAQLIEYDRVLPDVSERLLFQVPRQSRQISARINFALIGNET